jgi:hypothetical protein
MADIKQKYLSKIFLSVIFLDLKFCKNLGFSLSKHCKWERVKRLVYRKFGISEMDISEFDTFDDVISDMSISDISIAKNGHIGLDISEI